MKHSLCLPLLGAGLLWAGVGHAHAVGLSQGQYQATASGLGAELVFARSELGEQTAAATGRLLQGISVTDAEGHPCTAGQALQTDDANNVSLHVDYTCTAPPMLVELHFWDELSPGHRHLAQRANNVSGASDATLLQREHARLELEQVPPVPRGRSLLGWLTLGVEHILAGYDHLAFLLGLILVTSTPRRLAALISLFTLAHSLTLALASLELYAPPSALVEAAIAASICYVGLENLFTPAPRRRAALVFGFGLIHGFGFAGALRELGVRGSEAPLALLGFNLGVELGQLALLGALFPLLQWARHTGWFQRRGLLVLNAAVALAGACWLVSRVFESSAFAG